ncbi:MAG: Clp protease ClpP, partial [Oscillospiraceae bacterium]|nr:Clp protease ClpP [Oscillospiraceae bacterium]
ADGVIGESQEGKGESLAEAVGFSRRAINNALFNKIAAKYGKKEYAIERAYIPESESNDISAAELRDRLAIIEKYI